MLLAKYAGCHTSRARVYIHICALVRGRRNFNEECFRRNGNDLAFVLALARSGSVVASSATTGGTLRMPNGARGLAFAIAVSASLTLVARSQPKTETQQDAFDYIHACYDLSAGFCLPPERQAMLAGQCAKAQRNECEATRRILQDSGKRDVSLICAGPQ